LPQHRKNYGDRKKKEEKQDYKVCGHGLGSKAGNFAVKTLEEGEEEVPQPLIKANQ